MQVTLGRWALAGAFLAAFVLAGIVFVVSMNFVTAEKQIERRVSRVYPLEDPRFAN
jgi:hypothetical protein